nr:pentatricopeptide repeat-containing protein At5g62370 [Tanacetum cinerariifolium]
MIKNNNHKPHNLLTLILNSLTNSFTTTPLLKPISAVEQNHKSLCFSLAETLIKRGQLSSARKLIHRLVSQSPTITDQISVVNFARNKRLELDLATYCTHISRLVNAGEYELAEGLYSDKIVKRGVKTDGLLLGSMMVCYCKLGRVKDENGHFQKLVEFKSLSSGRAFSEVITEVFAQDRLVDAYEYCVKVNDVGITLGV